MGALRDNATALTESTKMTPDPGRRRLGANARTRASGPKKFTSMTSRSAASVTSLSTGRWQVMPALQTSRSTSPCARVAAAIWAPSVTSSRTGTTRAGSGYRGSDAGARAPATTVVACRLSAASTRAAPTPRLAPVIRTLCPVRSIVVPPSTAAALRNGSSHDEVRRRCGWTRSRQASRTAAGQIEGGLDGAVEGGDLAFPVVEDVAAVGRRVAGGGDFVPDLDVLGDDLLQPLPVVVD